jgi:hypothetical protein
MPSDNAGSEKPYGIPAFMPLLAFRNSSGSGLWDCFMAIWWLACGKLRLLAISALSTVHVYTYKSKRKALESINE